MARFHSTQFRFSTKVRKRSERRQLVLWVQKTFFVGNLARFFSFAVVASLKSFLWGYSMSFFEAFHLKRRRCCSFLLRSLFANRICHTQLLLLIVEFLTDWKVYRFDLSVCLLILYFQSSFVGAIAIGDLIKSTLGPKGMVKISIYIITYLFLLPLT